MRPQSKRMLALARMLVVFLYPFTLSGCGTAFVIGLGALSHAGSESSSVKVESFENTTIDQEGIVNLSQI